MAPDGVNHAERGPALHPTRQRRQRRDRGQRFRPAGRHQLRLRPDPPRARAAGPQGGAARSGGGRADHPLRPHDRHRRARHPARQLDRGVAGPPAAAARAGPGAARPDAAPAARRRASRSWKAGASRDFATRTARSAPETCWGSRTSVQCVAGTLEDAIRRIREDLLPRYPNVDDVVGLTHTYGCGVAIGAPGANVPIRTLQNLARNPNFGGEADGGRPGLREAGAGAGAGAAAGRRRGAGHAAAGHGVGRVPADGRRDPGDGRVAAGDAEPPPARDLPGVGSGRRPAMRRQRRVLRA